MAYPMPLVIPQSRTVYVGGMDAQRQTFAQQMNLQSLADLHSMIAGITRENVIVQERLGNPPQLVEVDNRTNKPLSQAKSKAVVLFGVVLARAAMRMVESELRQNITRSTYSRTGRLQNLGANWEWRHITRGGSARVVSANNPPATFLRGDRLVLVPVHVPYATVTNRAVASSGRLNAHTATKSKRARPAKSSQNLGFLAATTRALKRRSEFKQFAIYVEFTKTHAIPGELSARQGTGVITIRPRFKQVRV